MLLLPCTVYSQTDLVIARGDGNWPPYEMEVDGQLTGFHIELIRKVASNLGASISFQSLPWKRAVKMVEAGQISAISYIAKTPEREQFVYYSESNILSGTHHYLVKHKDREDIVYDGKIEQLAPHSVVYISGFTLGKDFDESTSINKVEVSSSKRVIELIAKQRHDIGVVSIEDIEEMQHQGLLDEIEVMAPPYIRQSFIWDLLKSAAPTQ
ncbi:substrate-binding periplasmic protein [Vibrio mexicanus]|uniref:substrate-binding periplasmic protein n=1 Tax=Vibrio mexicanus TaxID=1004326 RepID=UPI000699E910|nr:transporter substrate-binding domain-containing protein [Vibrio mexicanus]